MIVEYPPQQAKSLLLHLGHPVKPSEVHFYPMTWSLGPSNYLLPLQSHQLRTAVNFLKYTPPAQGLIPQ